MENSEFWERVAERRARNAARPWWQKVLIGLVPVVLVAACYANFRAGDDHGTVEPAAVRSACGYVDLSAVSGLFDAPDASFDEAEPQRLGAATVYSCVITSPAGLRLRLDLGVQQGTVNDTALVAMALTNQKVYTTEGSDGVLTAAKRSGKMMYTVTIIGSASGPAPLPEDKLGTLSTLVTNRL